MYKYVQILAYYCIISYNRYVREINKKEKKMVNKENKWTRYYLYQDGKKIATYTKKVINEYWLRYYDLKWICREKRTLEVV